jgi:SAM-dependent methyltransferase
MNFLNYAKYYNLLYQDKNYAQEVEYVFSLIQKFSEIPINNLLDLGCGTGKHDYFFAKKNMSVTGVDLSEQMIEIAKNQNYENTQFLIGDVRKITLNKQFDCVISLFHVASYQTTNQDIENYLLTAYNHLKPNGIFIFDFWYGPAVLTEKPTTKIRRLENNEIILTRISEAEMITNKNVVNVNFEIIIENKKTKDIEKTYELHPMRYWFLPEIEYFSIKTGFSILNSFEWMTEKHLSINSWNGIIILKK